MFSTAGVSKVSVDIIHFWPVSWYSNFVVRCLKKKWHLPKHIFFWPCFWLGWNHLVLSGSDYTWPFTSFYVFNTIYLLFWNYTFSNAVLYFLCAICQLFAQNKKTMWKKSKMVTRSTGLKYLLTAKIAFRQIPPHFESPLHIFHLFLLYDSIKWISYLWWQVSWHRSPLFPFNFYSHLTRTQETRTPCREGINLLVWKKGHSVVYIQYLNSKENLWKAHPW